MTRFRLTLAALVAVAAGVCLSLSPGAANQEKTIRIGVIFDFSGPFSAAGSLFNYRGAKLAIELVNDKGGVGGKYKIVRVDADAQSKADVAINEAERLLNAEHVDILAGIYSSAHAVPIAERVDRQRKFLWITSAISDAVFKDRNLQYTFRAQAPGSSFGALSVQYVAAFSERFKKCFGAEIEGFHTVDPIDATLVDPRKLRPGVGDATAEMVRRYRKEFGEAPPMHVSIGFNNMSILLNDVLPRAIAKHGGWSADALAKAARETDIPEGGTMQGYGVKFLGEGSPMRGQNERAFPAVYEVIDGKFAIVYPKAFANAAPVLPLPASSPFGAR